MRWTRSHLCFVTVWKLSFVNFDADCVGTPNVSAVRLTVAAAYRSYSIILERINAISLTWRRLWRLDWGLLNQSASFYKTKTRDILIFILCCLFTWLSLDALRPFGLTWQEDFSWVSGWDVDVEKWTRSDTLERRLIWSGTELTA